MIKTSDLLSEVKRIQSVMPGVSYRQRYNEINGTNYTFNPSCWYTRNGRPACIVGLALSNLGVSIEKLKLYDNCPGSDSSAIDSVIKTLTDDFEVDDEEALFDLRSIQRNQDLGQLWGKC